MIGFQKIVAAMCDEYDVDQADGKPQSASAYGPSYKTIVAQASWPCSALLSSFDRFVVDLEREFCSCVEREIRAVSSPGLLEWRIRPHLGIVEDDGDVTFTIRARLAVIGREDHENCCPEIRAGEKKEGQPLSAVG